tara:strand:- start:370 stop:927 length:558 start_codon:yes stop_codon:yes gene_type:complete
MAVSKYIQSVQKAAGGRPRSTEWYKDKIREFGKPTSAQLIRDGKRRRSVLFGKLQMFVYDPKLKTKLPYYDTFPLVLPIERYSDGFLGINLHYLPIPLRIRLLDRLIDFTNTKDLTKRTKIQTSYNRLKRVRLIKPTLKRYLNTRVKSDYRIIDADEWTIATLLPVAKFKKASTTEVWRDSRKMI